MIVVCQTSEMQTCRLVAICDEPSEIQQVPVTYAAGRDTSVVVIEHAALLVAWYLVRVSKPSSLR
jgi:hypothetical protein